MPRVLFALLTVWLLFSLVLPVSATDYDPRDTELNKPTDTVTQPRTMTQTAHILHIQGNPGSGDSALVIWFEPFKFPDKNEYADQMQKLKYPMPNTEIVDSKGNALKSVLVPGQKVKISFTYQMRTYVSGVRKMEIISCRKIELVGDTLKLGESVTPEKNRLVGTVLTTFSGGGGGITVYIEGGTAYDGRLEYVAYGKKWFETKGAKVFDKNGNPMAANSIEPFQRVEIELDNSEWMESSDSRGFAGGICKEVRLLEYGDKWSLYETDFREICVVVESQYEHDGKVDTLLAQPFRAHERYLMPQVILKYPESGVNLSNYPRGTILYAKYLAVNKKSEPPEYLYITGAYVIDSKTEPNMLTGQELSGVYGKKGDVALGVTTGTVKATDETVNVQWTNKTANPLMFGRSYWLEKKSNDKWTTYSKPGYTGGEFNDDGIIIAANSEMKFAYGLRAYTDILESGTYRIVTTFMPEERSRAPGFSYIIASSPFTVG